MSFTSAAASSTSADPLHEKIVAYVVSHPGKKVIILCETHAPPEGTSDLRRSVAELLGRQIHPINIIHKLLPGVQLFFELPEKNAMSMIGHPAVEAMGLLLPKLIQYNQISWKIPMNFTNHKGTTAKLVGRIGPIHQRADDDIYVQEMIKTLSSCDSLVGVFGLNHVPLMKHWFDKNGIEALYLNCDTPSDTAFVRANFTSMLPELAGDPACDMMIIAPPFDDPFAYELGDAALRMIAGGGASASSAAAISLSSKSKPSELKSGAKTHGINITGLSEKHELINALRKGGVTVNDRARRRKSRKNRRTRRC